MLFAFSPFPATEKGWSARCLPWGWDPKQLLWEYHAGKCKVTFFQWNVKYSCKIRRQVMGEKSLSAHYFFPPCFQDYIDSSLQPRGYGFCRRSKKGVVSVLIQVSPWNNRISNAFKGKLRTWLDRIFVTCGLLKWEREIQGCDILVLWLAGEGWLLLLAVLRIMS